MTGRHELLMSSSVTVSERAKLHLAPDGILAVWLYAESSPFVDAVRDVFVDVDTVSVTCENDLVEEENTDWLFPARDEGTARP